MNYIDLFAGAGGLSVGLKKSGFELFFANEIDDHAVKTFRHNSHLMGTDENRMIHLPIEKLHKYLIDKNVEFDYQSDKVHVNKKTEGLLKKYDDFNIDLDSIKWIKNFKEIDLIAGGPPCQGFSNAGRGNRSNLREEAIEFIDDPRNQLFKYFLNIVGFYSPKIVLIENVKGLSTAGRYKSLIEKSLENTNPGYLTTSIILDSSDFGVPQKRERIFFIGIRKDLKDAELFNFYLPSILMRRTKSKINLIDAIYDLPNIVSNPKKLNSNIENEIPIGNPLSFGENISSKNYKELIVNTQYNRTINEFRGKLIIPEKLYNHKARYNNQDDLKIYSLMVPGVSLTNKINKEALKLVKYKTSTFQDKYFKLDPNKPSRTIVAHLQMDNNGFIHPGKTPRGISPREAARIQSFPDWYFFEGPFTNQFKQIGNAVPPILAQHFGDIFSLFLKKGANYVLDEFKP